MGIGHHTGLVHLIALLEAELLAAIGLIVPAAVEIAPVLTPIAGIGVVVLMVLAGAMHIRRKEPSGVAGAVLFVLAAFVAWGRFGPYSS